jgi:hypothetical protein
MNPNPADYLTSLEAVQDFLADAFAADDTGNPVLRPSALAIALRAMVRLAVHATEPAAAALPVPWERRFANHDGKGDPQIQSMHAELADWRARGRTCAAIKPIRNAADHAAALLRLEALMGIEPEVERDTPEGDELELLALVIEDHEKRLLGPITNPWAEQIEAYCKAVAVPFDPCDPELTIASLIELHIRETKQLLGQASDTGWPAPARGAAP